MCLACLRSARFGFAAGAAPVWRDVEQRRRIEGSIVEELSQDQGVMELKGQRVVADDSFSIDAFLGIVGRRCLEHVTDSGDEGRSPEPRILQPRVEV